MATTTACSTLLILSMMVSAAIKHMVFPTPAVLHFYAQDSAMIAVRKVESGAVNCSDKHHN